MTVTPSLTELASAVRRARKESGLDQSELALASGVSTRTVHNIESAAPGVGASKLLAVLEALGLELTVGRRRIRRVAPVTDPE